MSAKSATAHATLFRVGESRFAVSGECVDEIVLVADLFPGTDAPQWLEGHLDVAGDMIPVVDFAGLLSLPWPGASLTDHLLIIRVGGRRLALHVERVFSVIPMPPSLEAAQDGLSGCVIGTFPHDDGGIVSVIDPERVLHELERRRVAEADAALARRLAQVSR